MSARTHRRNAPAHRPKAPGVGWKIVNWIGMVLAILVTVAVLYAALFKHAVRPARPAPGRGALDGPSAPGAASKPVATALLESASPSDESVSSGRA